MRTSFTVIVAFAAVLAACDSTPPEGPRRIADLGLTPRDSAPTPLAASKVSLPGYAHRAISSRFALGTITTQTTDELGRQKITGTGGSFVIRPTGMVSALSSSDSPFLARPRMTDDGPTHNAAVRTYFLGAGLPEDQIQRVDAHAQMTASGEMADTPDMTNLPKGTLVHYYSVIRRQYQGVEVPDSHAWAHLNVDGDSVNEGVYWPEIPAGVLADAIALEAMVSDPRQRDAYVARLPVGGHSGHATIHHTPGFWYGQFAAFASYDVVPQGVSKRLHYDRDGNQIRLPNEISGAWGNEPGLKK